MKNTHRNNTCSHPAALAARRFATIALMFAASVGFLPRLASARTNTVTPIADLGALPNQDKGRSYTEHGVILASDGNFYGTTPFGGSANFGMVFKVTPTGTATTLVNFTGPNGTHPSAGVIQASDGNLYGTTTGGGADANGHPFATQYGTVFKVTLDGTLTTIFTFTYDANADRTPNGAFPQAALVQGTDGNLYGTTVQGGTDSSQTNNDDGTIFKMSTTGTLLMVATVHGSFLGQPNRLLTPLIQGSDGNFYGTSQGGGNDGNGGTVFRCTPGGVVTVLHAFGPDSQGRDPEGGVVQGADGNFYGTTEAGGSANTGIIYRVTPAGGFTILHNFGPAGGPDGAQPFNEMILARDGNFYGTTSQGGTGSIGTIFQLTPAGGYTTVYNFPDNGSSGFGTTGYQPKGTLLQTSDGNFVGTTPGGNTSNGGTVYRLNVSAGGGVLGNISTRLSVGTGDNVAIGGFIVTGQDPKTLLIRGIGPSLTGFGVAGALANPTLELHQGSTTLATNDNWKINDQTGQSQEAAIRATTIQPSNDLEAAILVTLNPGTYTAVLGGKNSAGVGLVEVYDLSRPSNSKVANISTRGFVDTGDNVLIGGLIVGTGNGPGNVSKVLLRAIGPSLANFGVANALADPMLELHDPNGVILVTNDNWETASDGTSQQAEIEATTIPPSNSLESALVAVLGPGNYTAIVRGAGNSKGVALVEAYNLP